MDIKKVQRGLSRNDWLEGALKLIARTGNAGFTIEGLAGSLNISKSGFYWHFKDREELIHAILKYWKEQITEIITENTELLALPAKERLIKTAEMVVKGDLSRFEVPMRQWANESPDVKNSILNTNDIRWNFVSHAFEEIGFTGQANEVRTLLFLACQSAEAPILLENSKERRLNRIAEYVELLTRA